MKSRQDLCCGWLWQKITITDHELTITLKKSHKEQGMTTKQVTIDITLKSQDKMNFPKFKHVNTHMIN